MKLSKLAWLTDELSSGTVSDPHFSIKDDVELVRRIVIHPGSGAREEVFGPQFDTEFGSGLLRKDKELYPYYEMTETPQFREKTGSADSSSLLNSSFEEIFSRSDPEEIWAFVRQYIGFSSETSLSAASRAYALAKYILENKVSIPEDIWSFILDVISQSPPHSRDFAKLAIDFNIAIPDDITERVASDSIDAFEVVTYALRKKIPISRIPDAIVISALSSSDRAASIVETAISSGTSISSIPERILRYVVATPESAFRVATALLEAGEDVPDYIVNAVSSNHMVATLLRKKFEQLGKPIPSTLEKKLPTSLDSSTTETQPEISIDSVTSVIKDAAKEVLIFIETVSKLADYYAKYGFTRTISKSYTVLHDISQLVNYDPDISNAASRLSVLQELIPRLELLVQVLDAIPRSSFSSKFLVIDRAILRNYVSALKSFFSLQSSAGLSSEDIAKALSALTFFKQQYSFKIEIPSKEDPSFKDKLLAQLQRVLVEFAHNVSSIFYTLLTELPSVVNLRPTKEVYGFFMVKDWSSLLQSDRIASLLEKVQRAKRALVDLASLLKKQELRLSEEIDQYRRTQVRGPKLPIPKSDREIWRAYPRAVPVLTSWIDSIIASEEESSSRLDYETAEYFGAIELQRALSQVRSSLDKLFKITDVFSTFYEVVSQHKDWLSKYASDIVDDKSVDVSTIAESYFSKFYELFNQIAPLKHVFKRITEKSSFVKSFAKSNLQLSEFIEETRRFINIQRKIYEEQNASPSSITQRLSSVLYSAVHSYFVRYIESIVFSFTFWNNVFSRILDKSASFLHDYWHEFVRDDVAGLAVKDFVRSAEYSDIVRKICNLLVANIDDPHYTFPVTLLEELASQLSKFIFARFKSFSRANEKEYLQKIFESNVLYYSPYILEKAHFLVSSVHEEISLLKTDAEFVRKFASQILLLEKATSVFENLISLLEDAIRTAFRPENVAAGSSKLFQELYPKKEGILHSIFVILDIQERIKGTPSVYNVIDLVPTIIDTCKALHDLLAKALLVPEISTDVDKLISVPFELFSSIFKEEFVNYGVHYLD